MGKYYIAKFPDGSRRVVADFSMGRAQLFYEISKTLEIFVKQPSGVADDIGVDEHEIDAEVFVSFFNQYWQKGWLTDIEDCFVSNWSSYAAGIVENITLTPLECIDRRNKILKIKRFALLDETLEALLQQKRQGGIVNIIHPTQP